MITVTANNRQKTYFRLYNSVCESGICLVVESYRVIRETNDFALCIRWNSDKEIPAIPDTSQKQLRLQFGKGFKRIHKTASRFAFPTLEKAVANFEDRKRRQLKHLNRQLKEVTLLCSSEVAIDDDALKNGYSVFDGTEDYVNQVYMFN